MARFTGKKILVVDDDVALCGIIAEELADEGFDVLTAYSGNQALRSLAQNTVEIVLTDIKMPDGTGIDLLKAIRKAQPDLPRVFMMTGFSDVSESDLVNMGARGIFKKPVPIEKLLDELGKVLQLP